MFVKICGITRAEDAKAAVDAGAQALGFVFWPDSPRFIEPDRARAIVAQLPPFVTPVGIFVNQPAEYVSAVADLVGLGAVQLHGDEQPSFLEGVRRPVIKAVPVGNSDERGIDVWPSRVTLLLDVHDPVKRGGTGRTIDWSAAAKIAATRPSMLAGGLTPENVGEAIHAVRPFGIDVSSGVECQPGVKDGGLMKALFEAISRA